ncbi:hypothetical protein N7462_002908 [Penicillium macrosclerotiorum]|uniref:uncharacterized protein n=1 Tax=Penicillium macrosclerotiorum TaxID=303699 RepID=UPI002547D0BE|nr:uncharacterized protein N7462_002908 [Penicillium macrosclerotiorum]KAJ5688516.1 hypothetical protein N7462_002908 [Penicillium macrosclerotiorum]
MATISDIKKSLKIWEARTRPLNYETGDSEPHDPSITMRNLTFMYYHAARVDLAQYTALAIQESMSIDQGSYENAMFEIGDDLKNGISGLTNVLDYFSRNGHAECLPLSVLGYLGMPLILAAIDLKLSPSHGEMIKRQKRLDSLSKIIRHSESLYDVTDFVAAGTNQILQLAYHTTQNFFLPCESSVIITKEMKGSNQSLIEKGRSTNFNLPRGSRPTSHSRVKSWLDAFMHYPRAYLLISTSVDYSLAVGRLPYDNSLPASVRDIPTMGMMTRLPWAIDTSVADRRYCPSKKDTLTCSEYRSDSSEVLEGKGWSLKNDHSRHTAQNQSIYWDTAVKNRIIGNLAQPDHSDFPTPHIKKVITKSQDNNMNTVNLDFFDVGFMMNPLDAISTQLSAIGHHSDENSVPTIVTEKEPGLIFREVFTETKVEDNRAVAHHVAEGL